jgi:beta-galactosidase
MERFLHGETSAPTKVYTSGKAAERLAKTMSIESSPYKGGVLDDAELLIVGPDSEVDFAKIKKSVGSGRAYIFGNQQLAGEAGIADSTGVVYRVQNLKSLPASAFRGVGPSLLRWRDGVKVTRFKSAKGFSVCGDGLFAVKGPIVFDAVDPFQSCDRYRAVGQKAALLDRGGWGSVPKGEKDLYLRSASQSEDNDMRRLAIVFGNFGVGAESKVFARSLYTKPAEKYEPIAQYNVLGPWPSEKDDDHYMVDTIFPVDESKGGDSGAFAEEMAIKGDVQPNPRFHPLGLKYLDETPEDLRFLDWRPVVKSRSDGYVDYAKAHPLIAAQSFCTCYCVGFFKRRTAGEITIRFGVDWRGKIWVIGKAFEPIYGGHKDEGSVIYERVPVKAGDNYITVKAGCGLSV